MTGNDFTQLLNQAIWENALDAIVTINDQGQIVSYNPAAENLFGFTRDEVTGQNVSVLMPNAYRARYKDAMQRRQSQPKSKRHSGAIGHSDPLEGLHKDGHIIPIRLALSEITVDGQLQYLAIIQDISEFKSTEITLRESEAWFRDITESMSDWIWEVDANGVYTYCSENIKNILGYQAKEIIGKTPFDLMLAEEAQRVAAEFAEIAKRKLPIEGLENWNLTKNGQPVCLLTSGVPLLDAKGELLGYRGLDKDITDKKQAEKALTRAKEEAEKANLAKSEFLANMSHELRTPLNAILGFTQLFGLDDNLNQDQRTNLQEITRAGEHLLELINGVLDIARVEAGRLELKLEAIPVREIFEECHALSLPIANNHSIGLQIDFDTDAVVYADRTRVKQILLNLISNGIKYNQEAGTVKVKINKGPEEKWRISVRDTGRGISPENLQKLFKPFNRLGLGQHQIEGTGIGLVISKNLVEAMGGEIGVSSTPAKGSKFWIELPSVASESLAQEALEKVAQTAKSLSSTSNNRKYTGRILVVEDNLTNQALLHRQLGILNIEADIAINGIEALDFLSQTSYQLVLTDCNMPQMNGFQLTEIIRQQEFGQERHIPILAITANTVISEKDRCLQAGMDDYLVKPVTLEQLQAKIDKFWVNRTEKKDPLFITEKHTDDQLSHFDPSVLQKTLGEEIKNHQRVLTTFIHSAPANIEEIRQAVDAQDSEALNTAAHKLKSAARAIGARILAAICQILETNSHQGNWDKIKELFTHLTTAIAQVEEAIADYT